MELRHAGFNRQNDKEKGVSLQYVYEKAHFPTLPDGQSAPFFYR